MDVEAFLADVRCACCRRVLKANAASGYCNRPACVRHRYRHDPAYRESRLARNRKWYAENAGAVLKQQQLRRRAEAR